MQKCVICQSVFDVASFFYCDMTIRLTLFFDMSIRLMPLFPYISIRLQFVRSRTSEVHIGNGAERRNNIVSTTLLERATTMRLVPRLYRATPRAVREAHSTQNVASRINSQGWRQPTPVARSHRSVTAPDRRGHNEIKKKLSD